jgi:ankyrin repeat protein
MAGGAFGLVVLIATGAGSALKAWERSKLSSLQSAACDGDVQRCEQLVKDGSSVDAADDQGVTALSWAVSCCKVDVVRRLIELGADVNHLDQRGGMTPLMYIATTLRGRNLRGSQDERNEIARLLIEHGAHVNHAMGDGHVIGDGQTTLHFAAKDKNADLVRMLVAAGANRNAKSNQGYTPLEVAKFPDYAPNDAVIAALQEPARSK